MAKYGNCYLKHFLYKELPFNNFYLEILQAFTNIFEMGLHHGILGEGTIECFENRINELKIITKDTMNV